MLAYPYNSVQTLHMVFRTYPPKVLRSYPRLAHLAHTLLILFSQHGFCVCTHLGAPCSHLNGTPSLIFMVLRVYPLMQALLAAGADVLLLNKDGQTPAACAVANNRKASAALISSHASKPFLTGMSTAVFHCVALSPSSCRPTLTSLAAFQGKSSSASKTTATTPISPAKSHLATLPRSVSSSALSKSASELSIPPFAALTARRPLIAYQVRVATTVAMHRTLTLP